MRLDEAALRAVSRYSLFLCAFILMHTFVFILRERTSIFLITIIICRAADVFIRTPTFYMDTEARRTISGALKKTH